MGPTDESINNDLEDVTHPCVHCGEWCDCYARQDGDYCEGCESCEAIVNCAGERDIW